MEIKELRGDYNTYFLIDGRYLVDLNNNTLDNHIVDDKDLKRLLRETLEEGTGGTLLPTLTSAGKYRWSELSLLDSDRDSLLDTDSPEGIKALKEFRETGGMEGVFFLPVGADHEEDCASTWGPKNPDQVDWTGFPS